jgi:hypothetical protein
METRTTEHPLTDLAIDGFRAAKYLGVTERTLKRWRLERRGPVYFREGKIIRYPVEALTRYRKERLVGGAQ